MSGRGREREPNTTLDHVTAPSFHPMDVVEHPNRYSITAGVQGGSFGGCACRCKDMLLERTCYLREGVITAVLILATPLLVVQYVTKSEQL